LNEVYFGDVYSISAIGFGQDEIFENLYENQSPLANIRSLLEEATENKVVGRIPSERFNEKPIANKVVGNGPMEARYNYYATRELLGEESLQTKLEGQKTALFVGTMNNCYGVVGLRNGYRICVDEKLGYTREVFDSKIGQGFGYVHPMVPVYKIPNNVIGNLALDYKLSGENANFFGEDSSSAALQEAFFKIRNGQYKRSIVSSSNYLFLNYLDFLLLEVQNFIRENPKINPEKDHFFFPSEWACSFLLGLREELEDLERKPIARLRASYQINYPEKYYRRKLDQKVMNRLIDRTLNQGDLEFKDLDAIVFDNLDSKRQQLQYFHARKKKEKTNTLLVSPTLVTGYSLCTHAATLTSIAIEMIKRQKVFSSYFEVVPDNPLMSHEAREQNLQRIGVFHQSLNNTLHFSIIERI